MDTNRYHVDVGVYLRLLRQHQHLSQEGLAAATAINRETILRLERGDSHVLFRNLLPLWTHLGVSPGAYALLTQSHTFSWSAALLTQRMTAAIVHYITLVTAHRAPPPTSGVLAAHARLPESHAPFLTELTLLQLIITRNLPLGDIAAILLAEEEPDRMAIRQAMLRLEMERQHTTESVTELAGYPVLATAVRDLRRIAHTLQADESPHYVTIRQIADDLDRLRVATTIPFTIHAQR